MTPAQSSKSPLGIWRNAAALARLIRAEGVGIVHARWNSTIIEPLLKGTKDKLLACGVKESNIVVESVPGSWELPIAVKS